MRTDSDNLIDAGRREATPVRVDEDGVPFLVSLGGEVTPLEQYCQRPVRARGVFYASDVEALKKYLGRLKNPDSVIFWSPTFLPFMKGRGLAVLNFHGADGSAGHCDHVVHFRCHLNELSQLTTPVIQGTYKPTTL